MQGEDMRKHLISIGLVLGVAAPAIAQDEPFWTHSYNFFGEPTALTASVNLGDLDGDGDLDGFAVNGRHWIQQDEVYLNNGMGFFRSAYDAGSVRATGYEAALADLDGDGDLDAAIARDLLPVLIQLNDGTGHFDAGREIGPIAQARSIAAVDLDSDGDSDLVLIQRGEANLLFFNDGQGGFDRVVELPGEFQTIQVEIGDLNSDGVADLVFSNRGGEGVMLYQGTGNGAFDGPVAVGADLAMEVRAVALGDMNGDGHPDILAGGIERGGVIFFNDGHGNFVERGEFGSENDAMFGLGLADFDGDGRLDIAVANSGVRDRVYIATDDGFRTVDLVELDEANSYNVSVGDLNQDGRPDLVFAVSEGSNYVAINRIEPGH
tara:strand:- start:11746 stop:12879 length:1134 start_codon:yes stop_codon:yes gene_type:complete